MPISNPFQWDYNIAMDTTIFAECMICYGGYNKTIPLERSLIVVPVKKEKRQERDSTTRDKEKFLDYLEKSRGIVTVVCQKTDISRATYYNWRDTDEEFKKKADEILGAKPEILEDRMYAYALQGDVKALKFMISHYGRKDTSIVKKSSVDIYHHVDKKDGDPSLTIEDILDNPELLRVYLDWNEKQHKKDKKEGNK